MFIQQRNNPTEIPSHLFRSKVDVLKWSIFMIALENEMFDESEKLR